MGKIRKAKGQTQHAHERMGERIGLKGRAADDFLRAASKKGLPPAAFGHGPLGEFLRDKGSSKRLRVFRGVIVIFNRTSDRAITCYRIPDEFAEEYEAIVGNPEK